jgi:cell division protein FtsQ
VSTLDNTLLPDDLDTEDESLYRRRRRNIEVRRSRIPVRVRRVVWFLLLGAAILAPLGYGGARLVGFALTAPQFQMNANEDIVIDGSRFVSREEVLSALGIPLVGIAGKGDSIFRLNLNEKRLQVESIPWVRSAALTRNFPHHLAVHIVERTPVAFVNMGGTVKLIDSDGVLLEKPAKADFTFPVLAGLGAPGSVDDRKARLSLYQEFMGELSVNGSSTGWLVSEVDLTEADDLVAMLVQGSEAIQVHFGRQDFLERFHDFLGLLPELRKNGTQIDSVDLRFRGQVVVNPKRETTID